MLIQYALGAFELQRRGLRKGKRERGFSLIRIHTLRDEKVPGKDLHIAKAIAYQCLSTPAQTCCSMTPETGQVAANSLH